MGGGWWVVKGKVGTTTGLGDGQPTRRTENWPKSSSSSETISWWPGSGPASSAPTRRKGWMLLTCGVQASASRWYCRLDGIRPYHGFGSLPFRKIGRPASCTTPGIQQSGRSSPTNPEREETHCLIGILGLLARLFEAHSERAQQISQWLKSRSFLKIKGKGRSLWSRSGSKRVGGEDPESGREGALDQTL